MTNRKQKIELIFKEADGAFQQAVLFRWNMLQVAKAAAGGDEKGQLQLLQIREWARAARAAPPERRPLCLCHDCNSSFDGVSLPFAFVVTTAFAGSSEKAIVNVICDNHDIESGEQAEALILREWRQILPDAHSTAIGHA
jgi:hypothetical protein